MGNMHTGNIPLLALSQVCYTQYVMYFASLADSTVDPFITTLPQHMSDAVQYSIRLLHGWVTETV